MTGFDTTAERFRRATLGVALLALVALLLADIEVARSNPWLELGRIGQGLLLPDFFATPDLAESLANTLAFALLGVVLANCVGFVLALLFHLRPVQFFCAFIRAIHELFWALLLLQVFGLSTLTGLLAIAIPYSGVFARVYAEILEESDQRPRELLPPGTDLVSAFFYARLPVAWLTLRSYFLYRMECGIRSSAVLGFVGLPTLGFHLESAFGEGYYDQAAALLYLFFALVVTLRWWLRLRLLPLWLVAALIWLPLELPEMAVDLAGFFTAELVPAPLRNGEGVAGLIAWLTPLLSREILPGALATLQLSLIAMVASGLLALLLFPLISTRLLHRHQRLPGELLLVVMRSIPELILAFVFLLVLGPSMLPAILALALHNGAIIAHLTGRHSDSLLLRADAVTGVNRYFWEVLPRVYPQFLAFLLYRWEVIMRETAILGILGVQTLGFWVDSAFEELRYDRALVLILATALLNMALDQIARALRRRLGQQQIRTA